MATAYINGRPTQMPSAATDDEIRQAGGISPGKDTHQAGKAWQFRESPVDRGPMSRTEMCLWIHRNGSKVNTMEGQVTLALHPFNKGRAQHGRTFNSLFRGLLGSLSEATNRNVANVTPADHRVRFHEKK